MTASSIALGSTLYTQSVDQSPNLPAIQFCIVLSVGQWGAVQLWIDVLMTALKILGKPQNITSLYIFLATTFSYRCIDSGQ
jgi:hypothetical protein